MAGLEPATQSPRVCAVERLAKVANSLAIEGSFPLAQTRSHWVAGSRFACPAMTVLLLAREAVEVFLGVDVRERR